MRSIFAGLLVLLILWTVTMYWVSNDITGKMLGSLEGFGYDVKLIDSDNYFAYMKKTYKIELKGTDNRDGIYEYGKFLRGTSFILQLDYINVPTLNPVSGSIYLKSIPYEFYTDMNEDVANRLKSYLDEGKIKADIVSNWNGKLIKVSFDVIEDFVKSGDEFFVLKSDTIDFFIRDRDIYSNELIIKGLSINYEDVSQEMNFGLTLEGVNLKNYYEDVYKTEFNMSDMQMNIGKDISFKVDGLKLDYNTTLKDNSPSSIFKVGGIVSQEGSGFANSYYIGLDKNSYIKLNNILSSFDYEESSKKLNSIYAINSIELISEGSTPKIFNGYFSNSTMVGFTFYDVLFLDEYILKEDKDNIKLISSLKLNDAFDVEFNLLLDGSLLNMDENLGNISTTQNSSLENISLDANITFTEAFYEGYLSLAVILLDAYKIQNDKDEIFFNLKVRDGILELNNESFFDLSNIIQDDVEDINNTYIDTN